MFQAMCVIALDISSVFRCAQRLNDSAPYAPNHQGKEDDSEMPFQPRSCRVHQSNKNPNARIIQFNRLDQLHAKEVQHLFHNVKRQRT
jgi:hypothetical protein